MSVRISALSTVLLVTGIGCIEPQEATQGARNDAGGPSPQETPVVPGTVELSRDAIDFGRAPCGGQAPAAQTIDIKNTGTRAVRWGATLSGTQAFAVEGAPSGEVAPGATATVRITALAAPPSATAGQAIEGTLTITSEDATRVRHIPVRVTPSGGVVTLSPGTASFGDVGLDGDAKVIPLALTNGGNETVTVGLALPTDPQFELAWEGAPGAVELRAGASVPGLVARFKPASMVVASATAGIDVKGVTCGGFASSIALEGRGARSVVAITPSTLDFGSVDCGKTAAARTFTIANPGNVPYTFEAALRAGAASPYAVTPPRGTVAAGATVTVTVTPKAVPQTSATTADLFGDAVTVTTDAAGDTTHTIALHETARGARLAWSVAALDFGNVPVGTTTSAPGALTNAGNAPATVTLAATGAEIGVTPAGARAIGANASVPFTATLGATSTGPKRGTVAVAAASTDVLCAPLPAPLAVSGTGTNGAIALSTTALDFGRVNCGARGAAQSFVVRNAGTAAFTWTSELRRGGASPFAVSPAQGSIAAGASATVTVPPAAIPATPATTDDLYGDTLTIRTNAAGETPRTVALRETAQGAVLAFAPPAVAFGDVPAGTSPTQPLSLVNSGNSAVLAALGVSNALFSVTPSSALSVAGGGTQALTARYAPRTFTSGDTAAVTATVRPGDPLCAPLPTAATLTGRGTTGAVSMTPSALEFGAVNCGSAGAPGTVSLTNTGNAAYTFRAALVRGASSPYAVSPATGSVAPGQTVNLTVTPAAVGTTYAALPDLADTLRVTTTNAFGDAPHDVALRQVARGAIVTASAAALDFAGVAVGASGTRTLTLRNAGNLATTITPTLIEPNGSSNFAFAPSPATVAANGSTAVTATFAPRYAGNHANRAEVRHGGEPLCGPLPAPVSVSGTGNVGVATLSSTSVVLPNLYCATTPVGSGGVTLSNTGTAPFTFSVAESGGHYTVSPTSGTLAPGASTTLSVGQLAVSGFAPGAVISDTLTVTTDIPGGVAQTVSVAETLVGTTLNFNQICIFLPTGGMRCTPQSVTWANRTDARNITLTYNSNENASVTLSTASPFAVALTTQAPSATSVSSVVNGSGTLAAFARFWPGRDTSTFSGAVSVTTTGHLCNAPNTVPLTGQATIIF